MVQYFMNQYPMHTAPAPIVPPKLLYFCNTVPVDFIMPRAMHRHQERLEVIFVAEGCGTYVIGNRAYTTQKGDVLIFNSDTLHDEVSHPDATLHVYCCGLSGVKMPGLPENHLLPSDAVPVLHSGSYEPMLTQLFQTMDGLITGYARRAIEICEHLTCALLGMICEIPVKNEMADADFLTFAHIKQYFDSHYAEDISVESAAEDLCISASYLSHAFKKITGYSPIQYLIRRRIGEAQTLLIHTKNSVTQIAAMVGYDNPNYFTTLFTKVTGMSPKRYRQYWIQNREE